MIEVLLLKWRLIKFDILSIPHSVGKKENGGDPLKLYQYLTRKKYIIREQTFQKLSLKLKNSQNSWRGSK